MNPYDTTRLILNRLFIADNFYSGGEDAGFAVACSNNVFHSSGPISRHFVSLADNNTSWMNIDTFGAYTERNSGKYGRIRQQ